MLSYRVFQKVGEISLFKICGRTTEILCVAGVIAKVVCKLEFWNCVVFNISKKRKIGSIQFSFPNFFYVYLFLQKKNNIFFE